jgi:Na+-translocating ferredoxin:NAD+ oxidoreductase RnfG subunit
MREHDQRQRSETMQHRSFQGIPIKILTYIIDAAGELQGPRIGKVARESPGGGKKIEAPCQG